MDSSIFSFSYGHHNNSLVCAWGGVMLAAVTISLLIICALLGAYAMGAWTSANLMDRGADIALRGQESDDRRDGNLLTMVSKIYPQGIRDGRQQAATIEAPQYPALIDNSRDNFTITGLPNERES